MAGIAGIALPGRQQQVVQMLEKLAHRGKDRAKLLEKHNVTTQAVWHESKARPTPLALQMSAVWDGASAPSPNPESLSQRNEPFALASISADGLFLARDALGVKPLYYGHIDGALAFASEVKALLTVTEDVPSSRLEPGSRNGVGLNHSRRSIQVGYRTGTSIPLLWNCV